MRNQWNPLSELSLASLQICDLDDDQASIGRPSELNPFPRCSSWLLLWAFVGGQRQATETQGGSRCTDGHSACVCDAQQSPINATGVCQKGFVQVPNIVCSRTGTRSFLKDSAGGQGQSSGQEMPSRFIGENQNPIGCGRAVAPLFALTWRCFTPRRQNLKLVHALHCSNSESN